MRRWMLATATAVGVALTACSGPAVTAPTPEPWTPPPTATAVAPTSAPATATPEAAAPAGVTFTVERGAVERTLKLSGQVVSAQEKAIWFSQDGVVETIYVSPEDEVKQGQLLADLTLGELADQLAAAQQQAAKDQQAIDRSLGTQQLPIQRAQIAVEAARAKLAELQAPPSTTAVTKARAQLQQAEANLAKTRNDASAAKNRAQQSLEQAQQALADAQAAYGAAAAALDRDKDSEQNKKAAEETKAALRAAERALADAKIAYDTAAGNEVADVQGAEADVAVAQAALDELLAGPDKAAIADAQRDVRLAELELAEARQRVEVDPDLEERAEASAKLVADVKKQIESRKLYAPFDGRVLAVTAAPGTAVRVGESVLTLLDPSVEASSLQLLAPAAGAETAVKVGQPVSISFASLPGTSYRGTVDQAPVPGVAGSGYLIGYEPKDLALKAGDKAEVSVTLERREDALWLPAEAVRYDSDYYVMLIKDSVPVRVNVAVGIASDDRVEIVSGLNLGDVVSGE